MGLEELEGWFLARVRSTFDSMEHIYPAGRRLLGDRLFSRICWVLGIDMARADTE